MLAVYCLARDFNGCLIPGLFVFVVGKKMAILLAKKILFMLLTSKDIICIL